MIRQYFFLAGACLLGYFLIAGYKSPYLLQSDSLEPSLVSADSDSVRLGASTILSDLDVPWDLSWGPDNWIWFSEKAGKISRVNPKTGMRKILLTIPDLHITRLGLVSMILHPEMNKRPYVFINYPSLKGGKVFSKVVRYTYKSDTLIKPRVLLEIPAHTGHMGSRFAIGEDGKLMLAVGDFLDAKNAQNENTLNGKILRINIDGSIPSDNPGRNAVWARGFRVPQGLTFNSNGLLYSAEHGDANDDEINLIRKGANYGYPDVTGSCDTEAERLYCKTHPIVQPLKSWTPTIAPAGMTYYGSSSIPQWKNSLLLTTLKENDLRVLKLNQAGDSIVSETIYLDGQYGRLRDVCVSPDGDIYVSTSNRDWKPKKKNVHASDDRIIRISRLTNATAQSEIKPADRALNTDGGAKNAVTGKALYNQYCASCHKEDGTGQARLFPSLHRSQKVTGNKDSLISAVLNGLSGPVKITGQQMPAFSFLPDQRIADILTYVRTNFGQKPGKISTEEVRKQRSK